MSYTGAFSVGGIMTNYRYDTHVHVHVRCSLNLSLVHFFFFPKQFDS